MTARILRIELRRSSALSAALGVAAAGLFLISVLVFAFDSAEAWFELVVLQRDLLAFMCPFALGAGAWQARRDRSSRMVELLATTPRSRFDRVVPVSAAMAIAMCAAYLVMLGVSAAGGLRPLDVYFPVGAIPVIAIGALALVATAWLGLAIGNLLPSALTPPILVVAGLVAFVVGPNIISPEFESRSGTFLLLPTLQNPVSGPIEVMTTSASGNLGQALWFAALAATALALFAAASTRARAIALVPAVLGAAVAVPMLPDKLAEVYVPDRAATTPVCTPDTPRICVDRVHSAALPTLREPGRQALAILAAKLPPAPDRVEVYVWSAPPASAQQRAETLILELHLRSLRGEVRLPTEQYLWYLLAGAGVGVCANVLGIPGPIDDNYLAARWAAAAWLIGEPLPSDFVHLLAGQSPDGIPQITAEILRVLSSLPADEQRARVAALRQAELTCAPGDRKAMLTGGS